MRLSQVLSRSGTIPVFLNSGSETVVLCDVGNHHLRAPFFSDFFNSLISNSDRFDFFQCRLEGLQSQDVIDEMPSPSGFIFHVGRCGSTLMARAVGAPPRHVMLSEPQPLSAVWRILMDQWDPNSVEEEDLELFRRLTVLMGRHRGRHDASFIKFNSWSTILLPLIRRAFPNVPCLFLYRAPREVIVSTLRKTSNWIQFKDPHFKAWAASQPVEEVRSASDLQYLVSALKHFVQTALRAPADGLKFLSYSNLQPSNVRDIVRQAFGHSIADKHAQAMKDVFQYDAKSRNQEFTPDRRKKQQVVTPAMEELAEEHLDDLFEALRRLDKNICTPSPADVPANM